MNNFVGFLFAYLDPGTGSLILQVIAAFILSAGVLLRRYLTMPFAWILNRGKRHSDESADLYE